MNCKHCGEENLIGSSICKNCGQNPNGNIDDNDSLNKTIDPNKVIINNALQGDNKSLTQTSQQEIETIDSANKRICNNCNNPINKEDTVPASKPIRIAALNVIISLRFIIINVTTHTNVVILVHIFLLTV